MEWGPNNMRKGREENFLERTHTEDSLYDDGDEKGTTERGIGSP